jgi:hypothetical protein
MAQETTSQEVQDLQAEVAALRLLVCIVLNDAKPAARESIAGAVREIHSCQPRGMTDRQKVLVLSRLSGTYATLQLGRKETLSDVLRAFWRLMAGYVVIVRRALLG